MLNGIRIDQLPTDILAEIAFQLSLLELKNLCLASKKLSDLLNNSFWEKKRAEEFKDNPWKNLFINKIAQTSNLNWQRLYLNTFGQPDIDWRQVYFLEHRIQKFRTQISLYVNQNRTTTDRIKQIQGLKDLSSYFLTNIDIFNLPLFASAKRIFQEKLQQFSTMAPELLPIYQQLFG